MKKTQKPETKKQQPQKEEALNKELLKVEKAFATGLRAGPSEMPAPINTNPV